MSTDDRRVVEASAGVALVEYCGEEYRIDVETPFTIGRKGDLAVDDNPYLHRVFLDLRHAEGVWVLANIGSKLAATVSDRGGRFTAHLAPGAVLPLVFEATVVRFGAGSTAYEFEIRLTEPPFEQIDSVVDDNIGATTMLPFTLTPDQRLVVLALAERSLARHGSGPSALPATSEAARRLGWTEKKFNKKLDQVCHKLANAGVRGLHGGPGQLASNRRARLVEYCMSTRLITADDLAELPDGAAPD